MRELIKLEKELGETPLACLMRYKERHPEYGEEKMTYLGRLDPMAEGLLLALVGDTRNKQEYLELDKTYEFEVLWGFETDTYDILGLLGNNYNVIIKEKWINTILKQLRKKQTQKYPPFSSKSFRGDFLRARENNLDGVGQDERRIRIFALDHIHTRLIVGQQILDEVLAKIALVKGEFRQKEITKSWQNALKGREGEQFCVSKFAADVSSGTYIRSLAHEMGQMLGTGALAYSIKRTRVGEYYLSSSRPER